MLPFEHVLLETGRRTAEPLLVLEQLLYIVRDLMKALAITLMTVCHS